ncbi:hypothetical protein RB2083_917 [Rhodobacteraceae bacterium HTCC2083]|nr:hypothetical protein RB2083_917 [Rhodobacteraceae bacterium HTCC2083]
MAARHTAVAAHLSPTQHARSVALVDHCAMFRRLQGIRRSLSLRDTSMEVKMRE